MEKRLTFNDVTYYNFGGSDTELNKYATDNAIEEDMLEIAKEANKNKKHKRNVVCVVSIVFEYEAYGENDNGDSFFGSPYGTIVSAQSLLPNIYKTFETDAHVYKYHNSKDVSNSVGIIHYSKFNEDQRRIELVIEVFWEKDPATCNKLKRNKQVNFSMGCRVAYDVCSICGNSAKTSKDHCDHIKYHLLDIIDGIPVHMINSGPLKFFDCSIVSIPGDINAKAVYTITDDK